MKLIVSIFLSVVTSVCQGQIVTGKLVDKQTGEPVILSIVKTARQDTIMSDVDGKFNVNLSGYKDIQFVNIMYFPVEVENIPFSKDTIDLGELQIFSRSLSTMNYNKRQRKKATLVLCVLNGCHYLQASDLTVECESGEPRYVWEANADTSGLRVDFEKINNCAQQLLSK